MFAVREIKEGQPPIWMAALENPQLGDHDSELLVKGWIIAERERSSIVDVVVESAGRSWRAKADILRPAVPEHLGIVAEHNFCGFEISLPIFLLGETVAVSLVIDDKKHPWREIAIEKRDSFLQAWQGLAAPMDSPNQVSEYENPTPLVDRIKKHCTNVFEPANVDLIEYLTDKEKNAIADVCREFSSVDFLEKILAQSHAKKNLNYYDSQFGEALCEGSFLRGAINLVRYNKDGIVFYLIQYCYSNIGVFFPASLVSVRFPRWGEDADTWRARIIGVVHALVRNAHVLLPYFSGKQPKKFGCFVFANVGPYHYIYDSLATFRACVSRTAVDGVPVITIRNSAWLPVASVVGEAVKEYYHPDSASASKHIISNDLACFLWGGKCATACGENAAREAFAVINASTSAGALKDNAFHARLQRLEGKSLVLWISLCGQKRAWREQAEGQRRLVRELLETYPSIAVVVDGWTSPLNKNENDLAQIEKDMALFDEFLDGLPKSVHVECLIGATSAEKIAVAGRVDAYITNRLQGAIHVDNIARRSGVGHFNRRWREFEPLYYRHNCIRMPDAHIMDIDGLETPADRVNYDTTWQAVLAALRPVLPPVN